MLDLSPSSQPAVTAADSSANLSASTASNINSYRSVENLYADLAKLAAENPELARWVDIGDSYDKATPGGASGYDIFALQLGKSTPSLSTASTSSELNLVTSDAGNAITSPQAPALDLASEQTTQPGSLESAIEDPLLLASTSTKPVLFLQAALHGQDFATSELAARFAESLISGYGIDPEATWLLDYFDIRIVPIVNPDGRKLAEQGNPWRKNTNPTPPASGTAAPFPNYGVDLDRNYDVQWGKIANGASTDPASPFYQGSAAFSEPETRALRDYLLKTFPTGAEDSGSLSGLFINLQGEGEQILYPNQWTTAPTANSQALHHLGLKLGYFTGQDGAAYDVLQASGTGIASGTASDWAYETFGVATYTIAVGSETVPASTTFESTIIPDLLPALSYAVKSAQHPYQTPLGPDVQSINLSAAQAIAEFTSSVSLAVTIDSSRLADGNSRSQPNGEGQALPSPPIVVGARYSIDAPSWSPNVQTFDMSIASGNFDSPVETMMANINTSSLSPGRHTIFVEGLDANGNYGIPTAVFLDVLTAPTNASILRGTEANDTFAPTTALNFVALGRGGHDRIQTVAGQDLILAGDGNDSVTTGGLDDRLYGGLGDDALSGEQGNDRLFGEAGADQLTGGEGDDLLWGGAGPDRLTGNGGIDTVALSYNEGMDTVLDFKLGEDRIGLVGTLKFNQLAISQSGSSTLIKFGKTTLVELLNVRAESFAATHFVNLSPDEMVV